MTGEELSYVQEAIESNWIAPMGFHVNQFEREIAEYVNSPYAVAVSSGTAGLHLALLAIGIQPGDYVFCPTFTFIASINPIVYEKGIPIFIDSDQETWNMSPKALRKAFQSAAACNQLPKAVIVTHIYGQNAQMAVIKEICDEYQTPIIEDAAESLGSIYQGQFSGTIGDIGVYSFNGNKMITTSGGGMIVCKNKELEKRMKYLATQAKSAVPYYLHETIGYNYRMSNLLAAVGRAQLKSINQKIKRRRDIFQYYKESFTGNPNIMPMPDDQNGSFSNRWLSSFVLQSGNPGELVEILDRKNIESRRLWNPMHQQPVFKNTKIFTEQVDVCFADQLFESGISLPSGSNLTEDEQQYVIHQVEEYLTQSARKVAKHEW
ncbi:hypothetical protein CN555_11300 [Bacillus wiedmannii]|nr:hypothetical protein CN555_11300 [Bacillus wiedmannii]